MPGPQPLLPRGRRCIAGTVGELFASPKHPATVISLEPVHCLWERRYLRVAAIPGSDPSLGKEHHRFVSIEEIGQRTLMSVDRGEAGVSVAMR